MITEEMVRERAQKLHDGYCFKGCRWGVDQEWLEWAKAELEDEFEYHGGTEPLF